MLLKLIFTDLVDSEIHEVSPAPELAITAAELAFLMKLLLLDELLSDMELKLINFRRVKNVNL